MVFLAACFFPVVPASAESLKFKTYISPSAQTPQEQEATGEAQRRAKIWAKYKALAAGLPEPDEETDQGKNSKAAIAKPQPPQAPEAPQTGLGGILGKQQETQQKRGQIRILNISPPADNASP